MRIAFISIRNINNVQSSAHYYMFRQLTRFASVDHVSLNASLININYIRRILTPKWELDTELKAAQQLKVYSRVHKILKAKNYDVVFAPMGSEFVALLKTDLPIIYASDATFALLLDYYENYKGLSVSKQLWGHALEQAAIANASHCTYPSHWAAESAQTNYGADPDKISVIPYGANLSDQLTNSIAAHKTHNNKTHPWRLIFVASKWERKGGPMTIEILRHLRKIIEDCELHVCGDKIPAQYASEPGLVYHGFFNKNEPAEEGKYFELLASGTIMVFPSEADCSPHIINEAYAASLPVIARRTGGLSEMVLDGKTGAIMPEDASSHDYANSILKIVNNENYSTMKTNAFSFYNKSLNWNTWGNAIRNVISKL